jgi:aspartate carbamoyltransferase catalytic subunit
MTAARPFPHRHLLGIEPLSAEDITQVLDLAETFLEISARPIKKVPTLRGRTVINLFLEASTRTRTSFEIAAKRLSADAINISGSSSSTTKGETLLDTARNLMAMAPDVIVLRHAASGGAAQIAQHVDAAVVNAGDGTHEHPSQALLDCCTIRKHKGRVAGLEIAIVGDIDHSRVARSDLYALTRLGARVRLCAPHTMMPAGIERMAPGTRLCHRLEEALEGADVVMMLRIQKERLGSVGLFPNTREYSRYFGLSARTLAWAKKDAIVMHPGPINRGVELEPSIADGERSVILDQVTYGVAVRMAILYLLGGGHGAEA